MELNDIFNKFDAQIDSFYNIYRNIEALFKKILSMCEGEKFITNNPDNYRVIEMPDDMYNNTINVVGFSLDKNRYIVMHCNNNGDLGEYYLDSIPFGDQVYLMEEFVEIIKKDHEDN